MTTVLVDSHVHYYHCFGALGFLEAASGAFRAAAEELHLPAETPGCLLMTETPDVHFFRTLRQRTNVGPWMIGDGGDEALLIARKNQQSLWIVAGRQIATTERLEVLALGRDREYPCSLALASAIDTAVEAGAIPVIPWGFGKWTGSRAGLVRDVVREAMQGDLFLGDNGGRLALGRRPALFSEAEQRGIAVLPGSDPLPFRHQVNKVGRYGLRVEVEGDSNGPLVGLMTAIRRLSLPVTVYGRLERLFAFCRCQVAMQVRRFGPTS